MYVRIKLVVSKHERLKYVGNGNRLHGGLKDHAYKIEAVRQPREDVRNLRYDKKGRRRKFSDNNDYGEDLQS